MVTTSTSSSFRFRSVLPDLYHIGSASIKDSALIVIDVQNFYLPDGGWPVAGILETNQRIQALVDRYRQVRRSPDPAF